MVRETHWFSRRDSMHASGSTLGVISPQRRMTVPAQAGVMLAAVAGLLLVGRPLEAQLQTPVRLGDEQSLSLAEATARALANNLELRATRADTGISRAQLIGSRLRPNPSLAVEYQTSGERSAGGLEGTLDISLTQDLQLWGVRSNRIRAAGLEVERMRYSVLDAGRRLRREVVASYLESLFQRQRVALLDSVARVSERISRAALLAFQQALGSEVDARLSDAARQQSLLDYDVAVQEYRITLVEFARLLGDPLTTTYRLTDSLPAGDLRFLTVRTAPSVSADGMRYEPDEAAVDSLIQVALARRPDVRAAEYDRAAQQALLAAARGGGKPPVTVGVLYSNFRDNFTIGTQKGQNVSTLFGLGVIVGLPLFNRNQGEVARAEFAGVAADLRLANTRQAVERDVRVGVQGVALAASQMETLRRSILPANESGLRIVAAAFGRGQANIFQVLQVQRAYVETTTGLLEAMRRYAAALAELEAAVGGPVL